MLEGTTMSIKRGTPDKQEWLREAEEAYQRVFGQRDRLGESRPSTFSQIEEEAVREGNKLARFFIEGKISSQLEASGCHEEAGHCPCCGKLAKRKREEPETREIHARPGVVSLERYEYYCVGCRRSFFSR